MKRKQLLFLLALLMTAATGAWAQQVLKVKPITQEMATPWLQDDGSTMLAAKDLPDFYPVTEDEAMAWADVPQGGTVFLIYAFDDPDVGSAVHYVRFDYGNCAGSSHEDASINSIASAITEQGVKFYYTWASSVKLADGTKDAANWTIASGNNSVTGDVAEGLTGLKKDDAVTLNYSGRLKVKSVTATTDLDPLATPLTMECLTDGTIKVDVGGTFVSGMKYSVNGGAKTTIYETTTIEGLKAGDEVQFYGNGTSTQVYGDGPNVKISGGTAEVKVYGNIMSLVDEEGFATNYTILPQRGFVFRELFLGNAKLTDASGLLLPATTLASQCYSFMFEGCTNLTTAPKLPATTLADFSYFAMFLNCSNLTAAPVLPAPTLTMICYANMFEGCSKLSSVTCLATSISASQCLDDWLKDAGTDPSVTSRTLYVDPTMVSDTGWKNGSFTVTAITQ